jgi:hypothetical protein
MTAGRRYSSGRMIWATTLVEDKPPAKRRKVLPMCPVRSVTYLSGRSPTLTEISRGLTNSPPFRGGGGPYILCSEEGPLQRQYRAFCLWRPKTVSPEPEKERAETRFACDRDRFARARRNSFVQFSPHCPSVLRGKRSNIAPRTPWYGA